MLTPERYAWQSLWRNRFCSLMFICLVGIASVCLFGVGFMNENLTSGIGQVKGQIGADLVAVPSAYHEDAKNALFAGNACTILFQEDPQQLLRQTEGIAQVSPQLYMKTLAFSCCGTAGIQIIAFDPETDFTVRKWTHGVPVEKLAADEMIVGASCGLKQGTSMNIYGRSFQVAEVLEESGMGYDQSIFISYDAADEITASPEYAAYFGERSGLSSMLLIAAEKDADIEALSRTLSGEFRDVSLYSTDALVAELKKQADYFRVSGFLMDGFVIALAVIALFSLITVSFYQRKQRVGSLLSIGITRSRIVRIFFLEYLYLTLIGTGAGIGTAAVFLLPLHQIIKQSVDLPYRMSGFGHLGLLCLLVLGIDLLILLAACSLTFTRIIRTQPAILSEEQT